MIFKRWIVICGFTVGLLSLAGGHPVLAQNEEVKTQADSLNLSKRHLAWGQRYYKSEQYEDAETQLLKAYAYNPNRATITRYLGRLYNKTEKYDDAIKWYKIAIEQEPQGRYTKGAYADLAAIYVYDQKYEEAIEAYEALLELDLTQDEKIKYLYSLVTLCIDSDNYEKALEYAQRWGELAPDDPQVREMIGKLHMKTGGEDEALGEMEKVLEMNPDDHATRESLAGMYFSRGELDKAFEAYERLHAHDSSNILYLERLINISRQLGKSKSSVVALLNKMHTLQPDNLAIIEQLADATGNMKWVHLGLKKDPRNGKYPYMMGEHFFDRFQNDTSGKQDSVKALQWFGKALKDPQWKGNATAMIQTLDPPLTEEEKKRREFFEGSKEKKEEVKQKGKK